MGKFIHERSIHHQSPVGRLVTSMFTSLRFLGARSPLSRCQRWLCRQKLSEAGKMRLQILGIPMVDADEIWWLWPKFLFFRVHQVSKSLYQNLGVDHIWLCFRNFKMVPYRSDIHSEMGEVLWQVFPLLQGSYGAPKESQPLSWRESDSQWLEMAGFGDV